MKLGNSKNFIFFIVFLFVNNFSVFAADKIESVPLINLEDSSFRILSKVKNKKIIKKYYKDYFKNYIKCPNSKEVLISKQLVDYINSEK